MSQSATGPEWFPTGWLADRLAQRGRRPRSWLPYRWLPYGLVVDEDGIEELFAGRPSRRHPWSEHQGSTIGQLGLTIQVGGRRIWVRGPKTMALWDAIESHRAPAPELPEIGPEQIAEWLGIGLDESLVVKQRSAWRVIGLVAALGTAIYAVGELAMGHWYGTGMLFQAVYLAAILWWLPQPVTASPWGLSRQGFRVPWSDVTGVEGFVGWNVYTRKGVLRLGEGPTVDRVAAMIQTMLAAREAGAVLPRMTEIPDHALSRAESAEVSAERGISPAEGDGG